MDIQKTCLWTGHCTYQWDGLRDGLWDSLWDSLWDCQQTCH